MATEVVVVQPFADYAKGDRISDPAKVKDILTHHAHRVVRINVPDAPEPAKPAQDAPAKS